MDCSLFSLRELESLSQSLHLARSLMKEFEDNLVLYSCEMRKFYRLWHDWRKSMLSPGSSLPSAAYFDRLTPYLLRLVPSFDGWFTVEYIAVEEAFGFGATDLATRNSRRSMIQMSNQSLLRLRTRRSRRDERGSWRIQVGAPKRWCRRIPDKTFWIGDLDEER